MDDLLRDFLTESAENLAKLDNDIVELEQHPREASLLNSVFRTIHTIKGTCGFLGLSRLEGTAHAAENVLDALRAGRLDVQPDLIGDVLQAVDCIKAVLAHLELHEAEPDGDDSAVIAKLEHWLTQVRAVHAEVVVPSVVAPAQQVTAEHVAEAPVIPAIAIRNPASAEGTTASPAEHELWSGEERRKLPWPPPEETEARSALGDSTLRVGVQVLDQLMNLVGELALSRNQLVQIAALQEDSPFASPIQQLHRVTTDLLEAVMKTRMQPIGNAWTKLPRLVRDLSHASGKQLQLVMQGADTDLDRQILQAIQDPLTHMVRNSADHGIEMPSTRRSAGKPEQGTVTLRARHEGGHVIIEIADDGAGINVARVRRKAIERGLIRADAADAMPDAQILRLVFEPGFSTAEKVTNVSGRGVGMDVVRSNIEAIGGTVELASVEGQGTTVRVKIPLTLAIISALLVGAAGHMFAVPQIGVIELVRVTEDQHARVERVHGALFYRLRETLLPLVPLHAMLGIGSDELGETYNIVVCQVGDARFGLVVEEVFDTQEIVVKPVSRLVKQLQAYAGCTITGDGRVIMILDAAGIAGMAKIATEKHDDLAAARDARTVSLAGDSGRESILLFDAGYPVPQAVPLSLVARLEELPVSSLEESDGRFLVQYRGALIPVLPANPAMDMRARDPRPVIVFNDRDRTLGIAVDEIRDIVEDHVVPQRGASRAGVLGVCVIAGRAAEVMDLDHYLRLGHGDWFRPGGSSSATAANNRVLLVDDSRFFLGLLSPVVRAAGYAVTTASDGKEAIARLERGEHFDLILSDIDMATVDGNELARTIRANPQWAQTILVALTARCTAEDRARGIAAGFDEYLTKLDRDALLASLRSLLSSERAAA
jgi:two-component system chemotaxis sensor kinase CheA